MVPGTTSVGSTPGGNPRREPIPERWPEKIRAGDDQSRRDLNEQEQEEQRNADARERIVPYVLLRLTRYERGRIGTQGGLLSRL